MEYIKYLASQNLTEEDALRIANWISKSIICLNKCDYCNKIVRAVRHGCTAGLNNVESACDECIGYCSTCKDYFTPSGKTQHQSCIRITAIDHDDSFSSGSDDSSSGFNDSSSGSDDSSSGSDFSE